MIPGPLELKVHFLLSRQKPKFVADSSQKNSHVT